MAARDQLEIISPAGELSFHDLDFSDGITSVGSNPSNDIVLPGDGVSNFHVVIDHRQTPYQVAQVDPNAQTAIDGAPLQPGTYVELAPWSSISLGAYTAILVQGDEPAQPSSPSTGVGPDVAAVPPGGAVPPVGSPEPSAPDISPSPIPPSPPSVPSPEPVETSPAGTAGEQIGGLATPGTTGQTDTAQTAETAQVGAAVPAINGQSMPGFRQGDIDDEIIFVEIGEREREIDVEQSAEWQITIANAGALVARFDVSLEGQIGEDWVTILPTSLNLNEGARGYSTISITPSRLPTSRAGVYPLHIVVTSPNYPGHRAQKAVLLTINPYYAFEVGDVSPRQQTVSYFRKSGFLVLPVRNVGNSETPFRIEGTDDENAVTFEMQVPESETHLIRQIEVSLEPAQGIEIPIIATPRTHRIIGVGAHMHALTLTTTMLEGQQTPRLVQAQMRNRPIVGPWLIMVLAVLVAALLIWFLRPRIAAFEFAPDTVAATSVTDVDAANVDVQEMAAGVDTNQAGKLFGIKIPKLPKLPRQLRFVQDILPDNMFTGGDEDPVIEAELVSGAMVDAGEQVRLTWQTIRADTVTIEKLVNGQLQFIATIDNPGVQREYAFIAEERERATYILTARNWIERLPLVGDTFGVTEERVALIVDPVQPVIALFDVTPEMIVTGQVVEVTWQAERAFEYELLINGIPRALESARGSSQETPDTTTQYQLAVRSPYWDEDVLSPPVVVNVSLPTPVIRSFTVDPRPVVDGEPVSIGWEVEGASNVIIDPIPGAVPNLQGADQGVIEEGKTQQTFTLLATNGEGDDQVLARASRVVEIVKATPTTTATPTPTPTPTPTHTPLPTPLIRAFDVNPKPIVDGENVTILWTVEGASSVEINPILGGPLNLEGQDEIVLEPGKSQETFTIRAVSSDDVRQVEARATRIVAIVTATPTVTPTPTPTPTNTPQLPSIQVFELSPKEVVRGDTGLSTTDAEGQTVEDAASRQPRLTWTVIGEATNIEVVAPDFGPIQNLPMEGNLLVPANQTTVFQLNVYFEDQLIASQTQELTVLEPTPTPSPTPTNTPLPPPPTATPAPVIASFSVSAVEDPSDVVPIGSENDTPIYQVDAGSPVRLTWRVDNPVSEVRLTDSQNDYGVRSPEDEFQTIMRVSTTIRLSVLGTGDTPQTFSRSIRITVIPPAPPPPPFNVNGVDGVDEQSPSTVTWDYPGEDQNSIIGFRVYRANIDNFNFSLVADRFALDNTARSWEDPTLPSCDRVYYVAAVYQDITVAGDDNTRETLPSVTSWNTKQCE